LRRIAVEWGLNLEVRVDVFLLMHIPDGFLSLPIVLLAWLVTVACQGLAIRRVQSALADSRVPLMGVMAAFIFAAQMINFPVAGGTSGHLIGGALASIALGPWAAMLVMASVVGVQALLFQDGGLLALGANVLNMGIVPVAIGYGLYRGAAGAGRSVRLGVAGAAAWLSVVGAALLVSIQLWLSGASSLELVVPAMLGVHALIGIGEALITVAALSFVLRTRPGLVESAADAGGRGWVPAGLLASLVVVLLAPLASADPDGLERVAEDLGFLERAQDAPYQLLPDYTIPGLHDPTITTIVAGLAGVAIVVAVVAAVARLARRASAPSAP
jgi:cobalt/nickel transport system permease protein